MMFESRITSVGLCCRRGLDLTGYCMAVSVLTTLPSQVSELLPGEQWFLLQLKSTIYVLIGVEP